MKRFSSKLIAILLVVCLSLGMALSAGAEAKMTITWMGDVPPLTDGTWGEQKFEELFGVDVVIVRAETEEEKTVLYASGNIPDYLIGGTIANVTSLADQGLLAEIPLEMIQKYMPRYYAMCTGYDPNFFTYSMVNGKIMALPRYNAVGTAPIAAAIRADWLKKLNLAVPTTVAELENVFTQFTVGDPDGNGKNDTYAISAGGGSEGPIQRLYFPSIFGIYGVNPFYWTTDANGALQYGLISEGTKKALKLLNKWYAAGLIDPEFITTENRTSGTDVNSKFASGMTGYVDNQSFDDYQWDNDGHVNAKWVANAPAWQEFFTANQGDTKTMYKYTGTTNLDDSYIDPYYVNLNPVADENGNVGGYITEGNVSTFLCMGSQVAGDEAKMGKILSILESIAMDEEVYLNHFGPEGEQWMWNADKTQRVYNPKWNEVPNYHPQGQVNGIGWCLWPMYFTNPEFLTTVGGDRQIQRYNNLFPIFQSFKSFGNALKVGLVSEAKYSELTSTYVRDYIVKAIRGEVNIDETWDGMVSDWLAQGGQEMTDEANAWLASVK
jgi:putative aldouronate transport system substrate-binding protein